VFARYKAIRRAERDYLPAAAAASGGGPPEQWRRPSQAVTTAGHRSGA
jgi:hypothetical protein